MAEYNDNLKMLYDKKYGFTIEIDDNDNYIINGENCGEYEITMSDSVCDAQCCRIQYHGEYYYFG